ncbi:ComEC/Rec2 family competence protein [Actinokineospora globicatena]|uniref:Competence protein ComEC n=1 Tax=Actinokineospora globicatena TaxID=103729 RepID=A0A9W6V9W1_9PSEU|nr:ComEC/Rec2 family competence protein [Actinokineospora globicatena]GLW93707.1 competence protein ComEC [Actinokineospora globicatena]
MGGDAGSPDWRLVPGALAVWLAGLAGLLVHWVLAIVVGGVAVVLGVVHLRHTKRMPVIRAGWPLVACGLLALCPVAWRVREAANDPLRVAAAHEAVVELRVEVAERPRKLRASGFGAMPSGVRSVIIPATAEGSRVLLFAPVDQWAGLLPGQQLVAGGTLGAAEPGSLTVAVLRVRGPPAEVTDAPAWQVAAQGLRAGLRQASSVLDEESAGLLPALVVGDTEGMVPSVDDDFKAAGMAHLLAVSGANLAVVCVAVLFLVRLTRVGPRGSAVAALLALVGYVVLAGPEPSVLRAGVMGAIGLLALALGRERSALPALAVAVIVLVAIDPAMAVSFGFVLSVLATAALVLVVPGWVDRLARRRVPRLLAEAVVVPAAAHLATAPVVAGMSGQVSLVAVVANLVAAPVVAPATVFGLGAALVMPVFPWAAEWLVRLAGPEVDWLVVVGRWAARVPGAAVDWPSGWWGGVALALLVGGLVLGLRSRSTRVALGVAVVVAVLVLLPVRVLAPGWPPPGWAAVACDVGQGDAVVLSTEDHERAVLVDTGPDPAPVRECLDRLGVRRVALVILSHLHADHVGGLESVLADRSVGAVAVGPGRAPEWAWRQVRAQTAAAHVPLVSVTAGQRMAWPGLTVEVLAPQGEEERTETDGTAINNRSVVLRATTKAGRVLLTGDVELAAQAALLTGRTDLAAEVVKVPHHGSRYTAPDFLAAVGARIAVVSVGGGNRYGHPSPHTLTALTRRGTHIARTDRDGDTAIVAGPGGPAMVFRGDPRPPRR